MEATIAISATVEETFLPQNSVVLGKHMCNPKTVVCNVKRPRCFTHGKECQRLRTSPSHGSAADCKVLQLLTAGSPCTDFSPMGEMMKFSGQTAILFLILMKIVVTTMPKVFLFENVPRFPISTVEQLIGQHFCMDDSILCPSRFGFPVRRSRRYALFRQRGCVRHLLSG